MMELTTLFGNAIQINVSEVDVSSLHIQHKAHIRPILLLCKRPLGIPSFPTRPELLNRAMFAVRDVEKRFPFTCRRG